MQLKTCNSHTEIVLQTCSPQYLCKIYHPNSCWSYHLRKTAMQFLQQRCNSRTAPEMASENFTLKYSHGSHIGCKRYSICPKSLSCICDAFKNQQILATAYMQNPVRPVVKGPLTSRLSNYKNQVIDNNFLAGNLTIKYVFGVRLFIQSFPQIPAQYIYHSLVY